MGGERDRESQKALCHFLYHLLSTHRIPASTCGLQVKTPKPNQKLNTHIWISLLPLKKLANVLSTPVCIGVFRYTVCGVWHSWKRWVITQSTQAPLQAFSFFHQSNSAVFNSVTQISAIRRDLAALAGHKDHSSIFDYVSALAPLVNGGIIPHRSPSS